MPQDGDSGVLEPILAQCERAAQIVRRYRLPQDGLNEIAREIDDFHIMVAVCGEYNCGKSSLLNALLGGHLLPCGLAQRTTVPTVLLYGEDPVVEVLHDDALERRAIPDLHEQADAFSGARCLRVHAPYPILREISRLTLVDMPGIGSGMSCEALPEADETACLIVCSAEEPAIKETVRLALRSPRLREAPLYLVLTKCDKVPAGDVRRAAEYFARELSRTVGRSLAAPVLCKNCAIPGEADVESLRELLRGLQAHAGEVCAGRFSQKLAQQLAAIAGGLRLQIGCRTLTVSELDGELDRLSRRLERMEARLAELEASFQREVEGLNRPMREKVRALLSDAEGYFTAELTGAQPSLSRIESMLRDILRAAVYAVLQPPVQAYESQVAQLLLRPSAGASTGTDALERILVFFENERGALGVLVRQSSGRFPMQYAQAQSFVQARLIPGLLGLAMSIIGKGVESYIKSVRRRAAALGEEERGILTGALEELRRRRESDEQSRRHTLSQMREDLRELERMGEAAQ